MTSIATAAPTRRIFLGGATLSAAAIYLLDGNGKAAAMAPGAAGNDVAILNVALGLEHEAIGAYQIGAESHLLSAPVLQVAVLFQGHHKGHRDALIGAIQQLGGTPVAAKTTAQYAEALHANTLHSEADVLGFAKGLELGAINAYLGVIPSFDNKDFGKVCGRLAADETMHWTVLTQVLKQSLPSAPLTFGA